MNLNFQIGIFSNLHFRFLSISVLETTKLYSKTAILILSVLLWSNDRLIIVLFLLGAQLELSSSVCYFTTEFRCKILKKIKQIWFWQPCNTEKNVYRWELDGCLEYNQWWTAFCYRRLSPSCTDATASDHVPTTQ